MIALQVNPLPVRATLRPEGLYVALRSIDPDELRDAFMQQTIGRVPAPESLLHVAHEDLGKVTAGSAPAGLIFHVARCGSTLMSQMLKAHGNLVVYSEPLPINEIVVPPHTRPRTEVVAALRSLAAAFAGHAGKPYVFKFSSWNTLFCDILAEAFPETPWILSLRDPVEVGVSMLHSPPGWVTGTDGPAAELRRCIDPVGAAKSREEFIARTFGAFCTAAARLDTRRGRLVSYEALPAAVWEIVAPHFRQSVDAQQQERMSRAARLDAKAPLNSATAFTSDAAAKQQIAPAKLRQAVDTFARPQYEALLRFHAS